MFSNKIGLATALAFLMAAIIFSNYYEKRLLENNRKSIQSIYLDRLKPATDLFEMRQLLANRIYVLEEIVNDTSNNIEVLKTELLLIDQNFNILLAGYEKTFLVPEELASIKVLKDDIIKLEQLTKNLLVDKSQLTIENVNKLKPLSDELNNDLSELSKIQSKIGGEILKEYVSDISLGNILNSIQIVLAILIGVIVFMIFSNRRITLIKIDKHNLN